MPKSFKTKVSQHPRLIHTICQSNDSLIQIDFDSSLWFEQASEIQIFELSRTKWGRSSDANIVTDFFSHWSTKEMFDHCAAKRGPASEEPLSYRTLVNGEEAMNWLIAHRPEVAHAIYVARDSIPPFNRELFEVERKWMSTSQGSATLFYAGVEIGNYGIDVQPGKLGEQDFVFPSDDDYVRSAKSLLSRVFMDTAPSEGSPEFVREIERHTWRYYAPGSGMTPPAIQSEDSEESISTLGM